MWIRLVMIFRRVWFALDKVSIKRFFGIRFSSLVANSPTVLFKKLKNLFCTYSTYFFSIRFGWRPLHFMQYFAGGTLCEEGPKVASLARPGEHTPPSGKLPEPWNLSSLQLYGLPTTWCPCPPWLFKNWWSLETHSSYLLPPPHGANA